MSVDELPESFAPLTVGEIAEMKLITGMTLDEMRGGLLRATKDPVVMGALAYIVFKREEREAA